MPKSTTLTMLWRTAVMMRRPPGAPRARTGRPAGSKTMVGVAGADLGRGVREVDGGGQLGGVRLGQDALEGGRLVGGIGEVGEAIEEGAAAGLGDQVGGIGRAGPEGGEVELLQDVERLVGGDAAGG